MNKEITILDTEPYKETTKLTFWSLTNNRWNPDIGFHEPYFVYSSRKAVEDLGFSFSVKKFNDIDKSKVWFINIGVSYVVNSDNNLSVFDELPNEWIEELKNGNAYLIANNENEYNTIPFIRSFYLEFEKNKLFPASKLILLGAAEYLESAHHEFCVNNQIEQKFKIMYSPHMQVDSNEHNLGFLRAFEHLKDSPKKRKYSILNRYFRWHRPIFVSLLAHHRLIDQGFVSLGADTNLINTVKEEGGWLEYLLNGLNNIQQANYLQVQQSHIFNEIKSGFHKIYDKIPMILDKDEFDTNYAQFNEMPVEEMMLSYFHITSCTYFFKSEEKSTGWHEKEFKPMLVRRPFLMLGRPHMLKLLRRFGFLTFSRWFDESYDDIENDWDRLQAIIIETKRLCEIPDHEWDVILKEMENVLEYNYKIVTTKKMELAFFGGDLKNLISYI